VYYTREELSKIRDYLEGNWHQMKTISFRLGEDHGFQQAPLEQLSREEYLARLDEVEPLTAIEGDTSTIDLMDDCDGGACPIR